MTVREWLFTFKWHDDRVKMSDPAEQTVLRWLLTSRPHDPPPPAVTEGFETVFSIGAFVITIAILGVCALAVLRLAGLA